MFYTFYKDGISAFLLFLTNNLADLLSSFLSEFPLQVI